MLWVDSLFISVDDLSRIDGQVQAVATAEGITLAGSNGQILAGIEEAAAELNKLMIAFGGYLSSGDLSANHLAAVLNVGIGNSVRQKALLDQVCVSGTSPSSWNHIKNFAVYWVLRTFYRNALSRTVNDRYEKKMELYRSELDRRIRPTIFGLGVPIVLQPLYAPAAFFVRNSGTWGDNNLSLTAGSGTSTDSVDVVVTYVDQSQPNRYVSYLQPGNSESDAPAAATIGLTAGNNLTVSIASLNPPTGAQDPATVLTTVIAPMQATGWNLYVGKSDGPLYLQNLTPIPIATKSYTLSTNPTFSGPSQGQGQYQNRSLSILQMRQRA